MRSRQPAAANPPTPPASANPLTAATNGPGGHSAAPAAATGPGPRATVAGGQPEIPANPRGERSTTPPLPPAPPSGPIRALQLAARVLLGLGIIAAALVIAGLLVLSRQPPAHAPVEEVVRRVRIVEAIPRPAEEVARTWEGFGTARAMDQAEIAAEVTARVVERPAAIHPGVAVKAGDVLLKLDESDFRERLEAAQRAAESIQAQVEGLDVEAERLREQVDQAAEQVRHARWELDQLEQARARGAAHESEVLRASSALARLEQDRLRLQQQLDLVPSRRAALRADLAARRNDAEVARRQLERTTIATPIDGIIQTIGRHAGEMVAAGERIARIVDVSRIEVPVRVPASAAGGIRIGDQASLRAGGASGYGQRSWQARIARIAPEADPLNRTITIFLELQQQAPPPGSEAWGDLLMPGRFVSAELTGRAGNGEQLVLVPRRAVTDDVVWVVRSNPHGQPAAQPTRIRVAYHVEASYPELDPEETQWAAIAAGLNPADQVIITNLDELVPGVRVEVVR